MDNVNGYLRKLISPTQAYQCYPPISLLVSKALFNASTHCYRTIVGISNTSRAAQPEDSSRCRVIGALALRVASNPARVSSAGFEKCGRIAWSLRG